MPLIRLIFFALILAFPMTGTFAQPKADTVWASDCGDSFCVFRKPIAAPNSDGIFANIELLIDVADGTASVVITTPLGVALTPGVRVLVGETEWTAPLKVCQSDGCRASFTMNADDLAFLFQQSKMQLFYLPFGQTAPQSASFNLAGLVSAISKSN